MSTTEKLVGVVQMLKGGWCFQYEPGTAFVGAKHPDGGRRSVCEAPQEFGPAIAEALNQCARIEELEALIPEELILPDTWDGTSPIFDPNCLCDLCSNARRIHARRAASARGRE